MAGAVRWYRRAADHGHGLSQFKLGKCYATGTGVPVDMAEARRLCQLAADQGFRAARSFLEDDDDDDGEEDGDEEEDEDEEEEEEGGE